MPKLDISFKQTSKDMKLYAAVIAEEEKSDFVKRALEFYIKCLSEGGCYANPE
jgi:hypothetical protein